MRRQLVVNGTLLGLALASFGVVWVTRDAPTTAELAARADKLLPVWDRRAVTRIELERSGAKLSLVRGTDGEVEGDFRISSPWAERADIATVSALLGSLELASALRSADAPAGPAGLKSPSLEITVEMSGSTVNLALGGEAPAPAGARYLRVRTGEGTEHVYVVSRGLVSELDVPFDRFRETRLLEYGRSDFREVEIESDLGRAQLTQRDGVFFVTTARGPELAERSRVEQLLDALSRLATERFLEAESARAVLAAGAVKVVLRLVAAPEVTLRLGGTCPSARDQSVVLREQPERGAKAGCVPAPLTAPFRIVPAELEAVTPFVARLDEVEEVQLVEGSNQLDLARKERAFVRRAPHPGEVTLDAGNQLISSLLGARGQRVLEPRLSELGLEPPSGRVTLRLSTDGAQRRAIGVGRPRADGSLCVRREADQAVLCLEPEASRAFRPATALIKPLELLAIAPSELAAFSLDGPKLHQRVVRGGDGSYALTEPAGFQHDGSLVADVVQALGSLRAERWVVGEDDGGRGLGSPRLRAKIELTSGAPSRELVIGAKTQGGYFAKLSPDPGVFVLRAAEVESLEQLLIDRSLCPFDESSVARIELATATRRAVLRPDSGSWKGDSLDAGRAQALAETVLALRAERALHLGPAEPSEGFTRPSLSVDVVDAQGKRRQVRFGARTRVDDEAVAFARLDGVDATFAVGLETVRALQAF